jgi:TonB family protein
VQSLTEPVPGHAWRRVAEEVARRYGLRRAPLLLQSRHPSLLVTWGVLRPAVILPAAAHAWNEERIRIVLGHELAHIRRNDWLLQVAAELVRCVYWFNPIVWSGFRRMRQESEQACDDEVLKLGIDGRTYAAHLLDIARTFRTQAIAWAPASAIARPSSLERRVRAMLNDRVNRNRVTPLASAVVVGVVMGIAIPIAGFDALAQTRFATISGTAADESGAVLVDIAVSLVNVGTKAKYEVRTNQAGAFEFVGLPAGDYMFEGRTLGFEPFREAVTVGVGDSLQRNIALRIGAVQETITVVAGADDPASAASGDRVVTARAPRRRPCPNPAVGGCIGPPVKVKDVRPVYPQALRNASLPGTVVIEGQIGTDGRMKDMRVVSSPHPAFEEAALEAVAAWEFTPTTLNGRATDTRIRVSVSFSPSVAP